MREAIGDRRLRLDDATRIRLATLGKALGRELLEKFASIVTPDTILRWHRKLVATKWSYASTSTRRPGRRRVMAAVEKLAVRMAQENATWGLRRVRSVGRARRRRTSRRAVDRRRGPRPKRSSAVPGSPDVVGHLP